MIKKTITIILMAAFCINTCCYGLAPRPISQESAPSSDVRFLAVAFYIASHFLIDGKDAAKLPKTVFNRFRNHPDYLKEAKLDEKLRNGEIKDPVDGVVTIPFEKDGTAYKARISLEKNLESRNMDMSGWTVLKDFAIQISEAEKPEPGNPKEDFVNMLRQRFGDEFKVAYNYMSIFHERLLYAADGDEEKLYAFAHIIMQILERAYGRVANINHLTNNLQFVLGLNPKKVSLRTKIRFFTEMGKFIAYLERELPPGFRFYIDKLAEEHIFGMAAYLDLDYLRKFDEKKTISLIAKYRKMVGSMKRKKPGLKRRKAEVPQKFTLSRGAKIVENDEDVDNLNVISRQRAKRIIQFLKPNGYTQEGLPRYDLADPIVDEDNVAIILPREIYGGAYVDYARLLLYNSRKMPMGIAYQDAIWLKRKSWENNNKPDQSFRLYMLFVKQLGEILDRGLAERKITNVDKMWALHDLGLATVVYRDEGPQFAGGFKSFRKVFYEPFVNEGPVLTPGGRWIFEELQRMLSDKYKIGVEDFINLLLNRPKNTTYSGCFFDAELIDMRVLDSDFVKQSFMTKEEYDRLLGETEKNPDDEIGTFAHIGKPYELRFINTGVNPDKFEAVKKEILEGHMRWAIHTFFNYSGLDIKALGTVEADSTSQGKEVAEFCEEHGVTLSFSYEEIHAPGSRHRILGKYVTVSVTKKGHPVFAGDQRITQLNLRNEVLLSVLDDSDKPQLIIPIDIVEAMRDMANLSILFGDKGIEIPLIGVVDMNKKIPVLKNIWFPQMENMAVITSTSDIVEGGEASKGISEHIYNLQELSEITDWGKDELRQVTDELLAIKKSLIMLKTACMLKEAASRQGGLHSTTPLVMYPDGTSSIDSEVRQDVMRSIKPGDMIFGVSIGNFLYIDSETEIKLPNDLDAFKREIKKVKVVTAVNGYHYVDEDNLPIANWNLELHIHPRGLPPSPFDIIRWYQNPGFRGVILYREDRRELVLTYTADQLLSVYANFLNIARKAYEERRQSGDMTWRTNESMIDEVSNRIWGFPITAVPPVQKDWHDALKDLCYTDASGNFPIVSAPEEGEQAKQQSRVKRIYESLPDSTKTKIKRLLRAIGAPRGIKSIERFFDESASDRDIKRAFLLIPNYSRASTQFFRFVKDKLEAYLDDLIPQKIKRGDYSITAKSIGISSGEEPYSVAFCIYNRLKRYYKAHEGEIGIPFEKWLLRWNITIEAYDKEIVNLLLALNGRFDLRYDNPMGTDFYDYDEEGFDFYDRIPELHDRELWEAPIKEKGATFHFRENLLGILEENSRGNLSLPYRVKRTIRDWIAPIYVNIRHQRDMANMEKTKADIITCLYLHGSLSNVEPFIKRSLRSMLSQSNAAFFNIGGQVEVVEPLRLGSYHAFRPHVNHCSRKNFLTTQSEFGLDGVDLFRILFAAVKNITGETKVVASMVGSKGRFLSIDKKYGSLSKDWDIGVYLERELTDAEKEAVKAQFLELAREKGLDFGKYPVSQIFGPDKLFDMHFSRFNRVGSTDIRHFTSAYRWEAVYFGTEDGVQKLNDIVAGIDVDKKVDEYVNRFIANFRKIPKSRTEINARDFRHLIFMRFLLLDFEKAERLIKFYKEALEAEREKDENGIEKAKTKILEERRSLEDIKDKTKLKQILMQALKNDNRLVSKTTKVTKPAEATAEIEQKMELLHKLNIGLYPPVESGKTLWHIIPLELIPLSIRNEFYTMITRINNEYDLREKIRLVTDRQDLKQAVNELASPNNIVMVAARSEEDLKDLPNGEGIVVRGLVFEGEEGDRQSFKQVECILAALRALYMKNAKALMELYEIITGRPFGDTEEAILDNIDDPLALARKIKFILKPVPIESQELRERLNNRLLKFIYESA